MRIGPGSERDDLGDRAPYALPPGVPALQDDPVRQRRWFLFALAGSVATAATAGYWFGTVHGAERERENQPARPIDTGLRWAKALAHGSLDELVEQHVSFFMVMDRNDDDPDLWIGTERLVDYALSNQGTTPAQVAARALTSLQGREAPRALRDLVPRLKQRLGLEEKRPR